MEVELVFGINHGEGSYTLIVSIIDHFEDNREPHTLDLECSRLEHDQYKIGLLKILLNNIITSLDRLNNRSGCAIFLITTDNNKNMKRHANNNNIEHVHNALINMSVRMRLRLNNSIKGDMQILSHNGFYIQKRSH